MLFQHAHTFHVPRRTVAGLRVPNPYAASHRLFPWEVEPFERPAPGRASFERLPTAAGLRRRKRYSDSFPQTARVPGDLRRAVYCVPRDRLTVWLAQLARRPGDKEFAF